MKSDANLAKAKAHLRRGRRLVRAQIERVRDYERKGWDSARPRGLLTAMTETLCHMLDDYDRLKRKAVG